MFEVGFLHEVEYVFPVKGNSVDNLNLLIEVSTEGEKFLDPHSFRPRIGEIDVSVD
jgi:hypothetical protein